jgi:glycosyltransferase involved in cell wall biosynthesis
MSPPLPLVSIGLPVYNGENFVAEAIECVLAQSFSDWELVISDNASTDGTLNICRAFAARDPRISVHRNERNLGVARNYNRTFELSRGRYFAWLAHDDFVGPEFLERCLQELERDDQVLLAFPKVVFVDAQRRPLARQASDLSILGSTPVSRVRQLMRLEYQSNDIFWSQFGLIRRGTLEQTDLMSTYNGSDQVLLLEIALRGKLKQFDAELFFRREHPQASTIRRNWDAREMAKFQNADDARVLVFHNWRLLREHLVCIWDSSVPAWGKIQCVGQILRRFSGRWKDLVIEITTTSSDGLKMLRSLPATTRATERDARLPDGVKRA